ncbi:iron complex transport system substrate-binding protein [Meinhardsimonia xiamenensis]|uniref:Iron complex transport system substrate-binding protein n=1 Tax=Meinhardsimonia xiamenensis TaxID=990712 RepID=A0A1G9EN35_9RHOB|nr:iron complex transport system substrate-binding protein [Meinhardsimonia xiamenensis]SDK77536.1 iron complex transport system substrate-binding protein [Meinhardsimonia xiamenensis]
MTVTRRNFTALATALAFGAPFCALSRAVRAKDNASPDAARDVLSLGGSVTEIVVALGQQHRLRARDTTSTYPPEIQSLPDVGYLRALSPEGVLSVGASLILAEADAGPPEAIEVIRAADLRFVEVPEATSAAGILRKIEVVGEALGVPDRARALAAEVAGALAAALADAERPDGTKKRVMFVLSTQGGKITASGTGTAADAIIRMAGGVNAITGFEGYKQITDEAVGLAAPDVILMMDRGGGAAVADDALFSMPAIRLTPAGQTRSVVRMDGLLMLGFGPRTAQAVRQLNAALYGTEG